jgi:hypothetical protein
MPQPVLRIRTIFDRIRNTGLNPSPPRRPTLWPGRSKIASVEATDAVAPGFFVLFFLCLTPTQQIRPFFGKPNTEYTCKNAQKRACPAVL